MRTFKNLSEDKQFIEDVIYNSLQMIRYSNDATRLERQENVIKTVLEALDIGINKNGYSVVIRKKRKKK